MCVEMKPETRGQGLPVLCFHDLDLRQDRGGALQKKKKSVILEAKRGYTIFSPHRQTNATYN
jgi:hypothetical protein